MRVFLAHNFYRSSAPSGEDVVYTNERDALENSVDVFPFEKYNDDINISTLGRKIRLAFSCAWSRRTYDEISAFIRKYRPDVAHFHSIFPQISTSAYSACKDNGVPVIQTLHNYRFMCAGALLLRNGRPCEECVGRSPMRAMMYRCYRDSYLATGAQVWAIAYNKHKRTFSRLVDRYIALTEFSERLFVRNGFPGERITVKPNFLPEGHAVSRGCGEGGYALYVGRLSEEKGVRTLMRAWRGVDFPLIVLGDGPLRSEVERYAEKHELSVSIKGYCDRETVLDFMRRANFLIVPSECYEGFPMVVLEAFASGTPVIASDIGGLGEVITNDVEGVKFPPGDVLALRNAVTALLEDNSRMSQLRENARNTFIENYSAERNVQKLLDIYQEVIDDSDSGR